MIQICSKDESNRPMKPVKIRREVIEELRALCINFKKGTSAYAGPRYQKLYGRVIRVWNNRRGQPKRSAMQEPRPGRSPLVIRFASPSGKYELLATKFSLVQSVYTLHVVPPHFPRTIKYALFKDSYLTSL